MDMKYILYNSYVKLYNWHDHTHKCNCLNATYLGQYLEGEFRPDTTTWCVGCKLQTWCHSKSFYYVNSRVRSEIIDSN